MAEQEQSTGLFKEFSPETQEAVNGLIYLGALEDEFEFCGHVFSIRTLKANEELLAGQIAKEYSGSIGEQRAWMAAQVAMALTSVDHDDNFCPQASTDPKAYARARFNYVTSNWYTAVIEYLFGRYANLLQQQVLAIDNLANLSNRSPLNSSPSVDSLVEPGISNEPTDGDTQT